MDHLDNSYSHITEMIDRPSRMYLAHPRSMSKEVRAAETEFELATGIELVNPFYDIERKDIEFLDGQIIVPVPIKDRASGMDVVHADLELITGTYGVLAVLEKGKESFGTPMEIFYNSYVRHMPTFVITQGCAEHPWVRGLASRIFPDWESCSRYFRRK